MKVINFKANNQRLVLVSSMIVLLFGFVLSAWLAITFAKSQRTLDKIKLQSMVESGLNELAKEKMAIYEGLLRGGAALYAASKSVERAEWRAYAESLQLAQRFPEVIAMGVISKVDDNKEIDYLLAMQADGAPNFALHSFDNSPIVEYPYHYVVSFVEPHLRNEFVLGLDIAQESKRKAAADLAAKNNSIVMTHKVDLFQDGAIKNNHWSSLLFYPLYPKNADLSTAQVREQAVLGWVYMTVHFEQAVENGMQDVLQQLDLDIYENARIAPENLIYSNNTAHAHANYDSINRVNLGAREYLFAFKRGPHFVTISYQANYWMIAGTFILGILVAGLVYSLQIGRISAERIVKEQTKNLKDAQDQLIESQKMEAVGKLASGIAHDFNNILGGILGYAVMLRDKYKDDAKTYRQMGTIVSSAERGAQLTKELLGFARKGQYERTVINLKEKIEEALNIYEATLGKNVSVKVKLAPDLGLIEGDATQVMQILLNMGVNARDAMQPDGGHIDIMASNVIMKDERVCKYNRLSPGPYVQLIFQDNGPGIPESIRSQIYDPFFTTKPPGVGTGLGLSMIYGIMKNHGGSIVLDTDIKKGAKFYLYFPLSSKNAVMPTRQIIIDEVKLNQVVRGKKILLVDDEVPNIEWNQENLEALGATVITANDGLQALGQLASHELDLVIMDIIMPNMDGIKAYRELRKMGKMMPVVFASGYAESSEVAKIRQGDKVYFLQKPFKKEELYEILCKLG